MKALSLKLQENIQKHFNLAVVTLVTNEQYWKYPECNEVIYNLSNHNFIQVSDFITYFSISWTYKDSYVYSIDLNREAYIQDAIWNRNCHPKEQFLMPEIEWVNIYTWEEDKNFIIN